MCGIAGILTTSLQDSIEQYAQVMQTALEHRGSDDRGIYLSANRDIGFVHNRLAILDLSQNGHQPMYIANQRYWITFNGEIYNFLELRELLKSEGETFFSHTDTEVILKLYAKHGTRCVDFLRGMFAFAIWDDLDKVCFLARDPLGIKPLYYWYHQETLIFASELRAILTTGLVPKQLSPIGLYTYLTNGSVSEPWTIIENVKGLAAGSYLLWKSGKLQSKRYWDINFDASAINSSFAKDFSRQTGNFTLDAIAKTRAALIDSIQHHFISDVPVGIFLSGGVDSTALVAIAKQTQVNELRTYSIAFNETQWNEGAIAKQVAQEFGTLHTEYLLTAKVAKSLLPEYWRSLDQPTIDGFNTFCVSKIAHQHGTKVVLSGLGSDELFGGYGTFQQVPRIVNQRKNIAFLKAIAKLVGNGLERLSHLPKYRRLGAFLTKENSLKNAYSLVRGVFSDWEAYQLVKFYLGHDVGDHLQSELLNYLKIENHHYQTFPTAQDEVSYLELSRYMRNQLLRDSDVMSMRWGLELRVPFVDRELFREVSQIPAAIRLQRSKNLLTSAVPEIPDYITNRKKCGFTIPFEQWIDQDWNDCTMDITIPSYIPLPRKQWYRRWSLVVLQNWLQAISI
ncbi:asparagine synthase (glutamine-hydrolyzing) [Pseudanabaena sp. Chao 1811]|uniref:asparagine synthase (glutamine-hydrolyzing) n=1 Tax=Pseudanabaena sp. Chao 1811 TaxID=2963092 RepID=UPI003F93C28E